MHCSCAWHLSGDMYHCFHFLQNSKISFVGASNDSSLNVSRYHWSWNLLLFLCSTYATWAVRRTVRVFVYSAKSTFSLSEKMSSLGVTCIRAPRQCQTMRLFRVQGDNFRIIRWNFAKDGTAPTRPDSPSIWKRYRVDKTAAPPPRAFVQYNCFIAGVVLQAPYSW